MLTEREQEIEKALKEATPGPWGVDYAIITSVKVKGELNVIGTHIQRENAPLIANAPNWLRYCLDTISQLRKQNKNIVESWDEQKEEIRSLRAGYTSANAKQDEELYFWEPYAENHLETLTGGVVIRAEWIRQLINEATAQLREANKLQTQERDKAIAECMEEIRELTRKLSAAEKELEQYRG